MIKKKSLFIYKKEQETVKKIIKKIYTSEHLFNKK